jgi:hypothetical protein
MADIANCYFTALTDPDAFFSEMLGTTIWDAATDSDKTKALQMATKAIDAIPYSGYKLLSDQAREFPRKYVPTESVNPWGATFIADPYGYIYESANVPQPVLDACCLEAIALLTFYADSDNIDRKAMKDQGVKSYSLGGVYSESLDVSTSDWMHGMKSPDAHKLLVQYFGRRCNIT